MSNEVQIPPSRTPITLPVSSLVTPRRGRGRVANPNFVVCPILDSGPMFWREKQMLYFQKKNSAKFEIQHALAENLSKPLSKRLATLTSTHVAFTTTSIPPGPLAERVGITGDWRLVWPQRSCRSATTSRISNKGPSVAF